MEISLHSSLSWAHCWGSRLSCFSKWQLGIVWHWQKGRLKLCGGSNFWMLPFRCWGPLAGLAGNGTRSAKSMHVYSQASSGARCAGLLPIGKSPTPLCVVGCQLFPTCQHVLGVVLWLLQEVWVFSHFKKKQIGWLKSGSSHPQKIKLQSNSSNRLTSACLWWSFSTCLFWFFGWKYIHLQLWYLRNERIIRA